MKNFALPEILYQIASLRGLSTAYTPYQPERSQGTLISQWIYQSAISILTGFEAVNASMYDRSTALFEAVNCAVKIKKGKNRVIILKTLYPGDIDVINTLAAGTPLDIIWLEPGKEGFAGKSSVAKLKGKIDEIKGGIAGIVFPHINNLGILEDVDEITDLAHSNDALAIAVVDPILLGTGGLKPPSEFGKAGADIFVAEGQHFADEPSFGGPGLGIFGIRYNQGCQKNIRSTAGRFVGEGRDESGRDCKLIVLSTREQHIKREKATSNICSNEAFIATLAGASILSRGEKGLRIAAEKSRKNALDAVAKLLRINGISLAFPNQLFFNEVTVKLPFSAREIISEGCKEKIFVGVDVSDRIPDSSENYLLISFSDLQTEKDIDRLAAFFERKLGLSAESDRQVSQELKKHLRRGGLDFPSFSHAFLLDYYERLEKQNVSPDSVIYPLGSCTMKYNPYLNDYTAAFPGFKKLHPESPVGSSQGSLEVLFNIQEYFKRITGLPAVCTQPVAGAQGELVGLKMIQAYHKANKEERNIVLIPRTAHGTNPASAAVAGFQTKGIGGSSPGIIFLEALETGEIDMDHLDSILEKDGAGVSGIMITNPNTSGIFETRFKEIADKIHAVGGLVYMDGANMNAIAGWVDLGKMGVDAVHNNLHKTWSISHGGGGPGDAIVAVSEKLEPFMPGIQVVKSNGKFELKSSEKSIGSFHRHYGNFAHKIRCYTYLQTLGEDGIKKMSSMAVLSARYLYKRLSGHYKMLPEKTVMPVMHEFIITLPDPLFRKIEEVGIPKAKVISRVGKLFLDFGFHAPTVSFPEIFGLMIEPTESYSLKELDRFADAIIAIKELLEESPEVLKTVPHFTPIDMVDEVSANKNIVLTGSLKELPEIFENRISPEKIGKTTLGEIKLNIIEAHKKALKNKEAK